MLEEKHTPEQVPTESTKPVVEVAFGDDELNRRHVLIKVGDQRTLLSPADLMLAPQKLAQQLANKGVLVFNKGTCADITAAAEATAKATSGKPTFQVPLVSGWHRRVSASKLHDIARILNVEVVSFFEDAAYPERLANIVDSDMPRRIDLLIASKLSQLPEGQLKRQLTALIFALAGRTPPVEEPSAAGAANEEGDRGGSLVGRYTGRALVGNFAAVFSSYDQTDSRK